MGAGAGMAGCVVVLPAKFGEEFLSFSSFLGGLNFFAGAPKHPCTPPPSSLAICCWASESKQDGAAGRTAAESVVHLGWVEKTTALKCGHGSIVLLARVLLRLFGLLWAWLGHAQSSLGHHLDRRAAPPRAPRRSRHGPGPDSGRNLGEPGLFFDSLCALVFLGFLDLVSENGCETPPSLFSPTDQVRISAATVLPRRRQVRQIGGQETPAFPQP